VTLRRHEDRIRDRFGLLLVLLASAFVSLGFAASPWARLLAALLQVAAVVVAFMATRLRRDHRWLGVLAIVGVVTLVLAVPSDGMASGLGASVVGMVLLAVLVAVLDRVLRHRHVTIQTLYGAVCAYFLIGLIFSSAYGAMNAFGTEPIFGEPVNQSVYSYFSFTTLTTAGFGDYTAKTDLARRVVAIEAVMGQVFIATTLARLVSLYKSTSTPDGGTDPS
jgi:hypothetical protein